MCAIISGAALAWQKDAGRIPRKTIFSQPKARSCVPPDIKGFFLESRVRSSPSHLIRRCADVIEGKLGSFSSLSSPTETDDIQLKKKERGMQSRTCPRSILCSI